MSCKCLGVCVCDPEFASRALARQREITGEPLNSRSRILAPNRREITGVDCIVNGCHACQLVSRKQPPEPMTTTLIPLGPWRELGVDLMDIQNGNHLLVVIDYFSRWSEVAVIRNTTASKVIQCMAKMFCTHGLPIHVRSDNGPQFTSELFTKFMCENGIEHIKGIPYWLHSNGEVENLTVTFTVTVTVTITMYTLTPPVDFALLTKDWVLLSTSRVRKQMFKLENFTCLWSWIHLVFSCGSCYYAVWSLPLKVRYIEGGNFEWHLRVFAGMMLFCHESDVECILRYIWKQLGLCSMCRKTTVMTEQRGN